MAYLSCEEENVSPQEQNWFYIKVMNVDRMWMTMTRRISWYYSYLVFSASRFHSPVANDGADDPPNWSSPVPQPQFPVALLR